MTETSGGAPRRRRPVTFSQLVRLASVLTDRDREIAFFLYRHQVLTTEQLELLFFSSKRMAQRRLLRLHEHRVVERFYPPIRYGQGKQQAHWILGDAGVKVVAACLEIESKALALARRDEWDAYPQLAHRLELNAFVTELVKATLADPALGITAWWGQTGAGRRLALDTGRRVVAPDAAFEFVCTAGVIECYLEWDRGTETAWRLADKVRRYEQLFRKTHYIERTPINLLFVVPSGRRLRSLQQSVQGLVSERPHRMTELFMEWPAVATTVPDLRRDGPLGQIWRNIAGEGESRSLTELMPRFGEPARLEWSLGRQWGDGRFSLREEPVWDSEGRLLNPPRPLEDPFDLPAGRREAA